MRHRLTEMQDYQQPTRSAQDYRCHLRTGMAAPARSHVLCTQGPLKGVFALVSLKIGFKKILYHAYYLPYTTVLLTVSDHS